MLRPAPAPAPQRRERAAAVAVGAHGAAADTWPLPSSLQQLDKPSEAGVGRDELARAALEERAPLVRNPVRVLEVLLEQRVGVARVQSVHVVHSHRLCCTSRDPSRVGA